MSQIISIILIGIALSMDAFAVSVCKGLALGKKYKISHSIKAGAYFGIFQALMPLLGYYLGSLFASYVEAVDHWISFALLGFIGGKMVYDAIKGEEEDSSSDMGFKTMIMLAIATSIDALAVGVTFATEGMEVFSSVGVIGVTTFIFSFVGVKIGNLFGNKFQSKAEICGGLILIGMGIKFLIEGLIS